MEDLILVSSQFDQHQNMHVLKTELGVLTVFSLIQFNLKPVQLPLCLWGQHIWAGNVTDYPSTFLCASLKRRMELEEF